MAYKYMDGEATIVLEDDGTVTYHLDGKSKVLPPMTAMVYAAKGHRRRIVEELEAGNTVILTPLEIQQMIQGDAVARADDTCTFKGP